MTFETSLFPRAKSGEDSVNFVFDDEAPSQSCGGVTLKLFQRLRVQLSLGRSNVQHEKLELRLVEPVIPGFSVTEEEDKDKEEAMETDNNGKDETPSKRPAEKKAEEESGKKKRMKKK